MESPVTELRNARERRGMSLSDIADATLINVRFLEELERGNFTFLPQTYVRAFLKEYATTVGLSPEEILRSYDAQTSPPPPPAPVPENTVPLPAPAPVAAPQKKDGPQIHPTMALVALVVIGVLAVAVALWNIMDTETPTAVREIPFDAVRKEQERSLATDSTAPAAALQTAPATGDTLLLTAVASDSVWIQVVIDNATTRNILLKRDGSSSWKAARRFLLTLGNAGAVEFTLNKKRLGKLGKAGTVLKNVELNHSTLIQK